MNYVWSWQAFFESAPDGVHTYIEMLLGGALWTLALTLCACIFSITFGSALGVIRTTQSRYITAAATIYVEVFRNIPLIVQLFLWYFVLPDLLPISMGNALKQMPPPWGSFVPAAICLGFYGSSRIAEQIRAGILSLPRSQFHAATALGLTQTQVYRYVILPEALRIVIPPLTSEFVATVKYSSVALTIGLLELTGEALSMQEYSFHVFEAFSAATVIYFVINWSVILGMRALEHRFAVPGLGPKNGAH